MLISNVCCTVFLFFCDPTYISGVHHSSSAFPPISLGFTILLLRSHLYLWGSPFFFCDPTYISGVHHSSSAFPPISLGFTILLLRSHLYLWGSPFFFCIPTYISGVHHSSSSVFPAISMGFTILLLHLRSQLYNSSNGIQRCILRFFTISSLLGEPSAAHMLKYSGCNHVQIMCNTSSTYHVQHVVLCATWYEGTAQLLSLTELKSHLFWLYFIGLIIDR